VPGSEKFNKMLTTEIKLELEERSIANPCWVPLGALILVLSGDMDEKLSPSINLYPANADVERSLSYTTYISNLQKAKRAKKEFPNTIPTVQLNQKTMVIVSIPLVCRIEKIRGVEVREVSREDLDVKLYTDELEENLSVKQYRKVSFDFHTTALRLTISRNIQSLTISLLS